MTHIIDQLIAMSLQNNIKFSKIILSYRAFDLLCTELGIRKVTEYKGYSVNMDFTQIFNIDYLKVELQ